MVQEHTPQHKAYTVQTTRVYIITQTETYTSTDDLSIHQSSKGVYWYKQLWHTPTHKGVYGLKT